METPTIKPVRKYTKKNAEKPVEIEIDVFAENLKLFILNGNKQHFKYTRYGSDKEGNIYNIKSGRILKQEMDKYEYKNCNVRYEKKNSWCKGRTVYI